MTIRSRGEDLDPDVAQDRRRTERRRRLLIGALSVVGHVLVALVVVRAQPEPPHRVEPEAITVALVTPPPPVLTPKPEEPKPEPPAPPRPEPPKESVKPPPPRKVARKPRTPPPPEIAVVLPTGDEVSVAESDIGIEVSDAELAGATTAGSGGGGGGCNMTRLLEEALRSDRRVRAAVAGAHRGKAIRVWNGDWVRHGGEEGHGLAAVREAIIWEIAFAPKECRTEPVRGLVLISLNDGPGSARLVMGSDRWRWTDLLQLQRARR